MDYSARSQMNSVNDHMSYTEDINHIIDSKLCSNFHIWVFRLMQQGRSIQLLANIKAWRISVTERAIYSSSI